MRYGIEIRQTHDAHGRPAPQVFRHDLPDRGNAETALADVYRFVRQFEPTRTGRPGEYWYRDPERGHGVLVVLGLGPHDLPRLEERVQLHELERAIGMRDPYLWDRHAAGSVRIWRNPWVSTLIGAVFAIIGCVAVLMSLSLHGEPGRDPAVTWVGVGFGFAIAAIGVILGVLHIRRIQWWTRARAAVNSAGLPMPTDLSPFE